MSITGLFDATATSDFDGQGSYYPAHLLPHGTLKSENVDVSSYLFPRGFQSKVMLQFALPKWGNGRPDNVISNGQRIDVHLGHIREFHVLYAGDWIDGARCLSTPNAEG